MLTNHEELLPGEHTGNRANLSKLSFLKESQLLRKTGFYFLLPSLLLGVLALASPLIYMIVPVYETYQCYEYYNLDSTKCYILEANLCIFYFINWSQTLILVLLLYKIRNVKDELNLKNELFIIIGIWLFFSLFYFLALQVEITSRDIDPTDSNLKYVSILIFALIQSRNMLSFSVSTFFCYKTSRDPMVVAYHNKAPEFPT